ncbi:MAG: 3-dehydroquinate synthase [Candidatus Sericytochromatia bacterium]|nr:3-dehydroquinate synthase [Candidatus Sericytochromatia bacterium]
MTDSSSNLVLTGFMGAGKSTTGKALATALGRPFFDVDAHVERLSGRTIAQIFASDGEAAFRDLESAVIREVTARQGQVIATGGGALLRPDNVQALCATGVLIHLDASLDTVQARIGPATHRPLANDPGGLARLATTRKAVYAQVPWQVQTDGRTVGQVVQAILDDLPQGLAVGGPVQPVDTVWVELAERRYPVHFGPLRALPAAMTGLPSDRRMLLVTDGHVGPLYADDVQALLESAGFTVGRVTDAAGESSKSFEELERLARAAAQSGLTRRSLIVALGGGVVGDLAGFAAASYLRGVGCVQIPTSLLAMVDSSVGGKVAINLPEGKNLVGAFHQPQLVWIDRAFLTTLDAGELRSGWAEVIKVAAGLDREFFQWIEDRAGLPTGDDLAAAIGRAVALKAAVVSRDEHENGWRMTLNLGHTLGHALEAAGGYGQWRHGDAVAWGLLAASRMAELADLAAPSWVERLQQVLADAGLPIQLTGPPPADRFLAALQQDKKRGDRLRFLIPVAPGQVVIRDDLPATIWQAAARAGGMHFDDGDLGP